MKYITSNNNFKSLKKSHKHFDGSEEEEKRLIVELGHIKAETDCYLTRLLNRFKN